MDNQEIQQDSLIEDAKSLFCIADFYYTENEAGGTGRWHTEMQGNVVELHLRSYGCDYNRPVLENESEVRAKLEENGFTLKIIKRD